MSKTPYFARFVNRKDNPFAWIGQDKAERTEAKEKKKSTEIKEKVAIDSIKKEKNKRKINKIDIPNKTI